MPWCPNCRDEFESTIANCSDCGAPLVAELPLIEEEEPDKAAFLVEVVDSIEASRIEALLTDCKIPVLRKCQDAGAYMEVFMGVSRLGVKLYVPSKELERAMEILNVGLNTGGEIGIEEWRDKKEAEGIAGVEEFEGTDGVEKVEETEEVEEALDENVYRNWYRARENVWILIGLPFIITVIVYIVRDLMNFFETIKFK